MKKNLTSFTTTLVLPLLLFWVTSSIAFSQNTTTWIGVANSSWNWDYNWTNGIPDSNKDAIIPITPKACNIFFHSPAVAKSVTVLAGGKLILNSIASKLFVNNSTGSAIINHGTVTNYGEINIGNSGTIGEHGIENYGYFQNISIYNNFGRLYIDNVNEHGIWNKSTGTFLNTRTVIIGANQKIGKSGIYNEGVFHNSPGGYLKLEECEDIGISNQSNGTFNNHAKIIFGSTVSIGNDGLRNQGLFNNHVGGDMEIEGCRNGIWNQTGSEFNNHSKITIGVTLYPQLNGIQNDGTFINKSNGEIEIINTGQNGFWAVRNSFVNEGKIIIGQGGSIGMDGFINGSLQTNSAFMNKTCAEFFLYDNLNNNSNSIITNEGLFSINTSQIHTIGTFNNKGIVEDVQGSLGAITNNEIIIAPTIVNTCTITSPAFNLDNPIDFSIEGIFTNQDVMTLAGTFNASTNTFIPTSPLSQSTHTFYVKIKDFSGNCTRIIPWELTILSDTESPTISNCPINITQPMETGQCGATVNWTLPTASDNCDTNPMITQTAGSMSGSFFTEGTETISYKASDGSGNESIECSFTVTILSDMEKPSIVCPNNITQTMEMGQCGTTVNWTLPTASDNCDPSPMITQTAGSISGSFFTEGSETISYTSTDGSGNESSECSFTVTILSDTEKPTISCPMNIIQPMETGQCGATVNWTLPTANDNCDASPMITQTAGSMSGSFFTAGTETISYAATDGSGNESIECSFTVTILSDTEQPSIVCPMNITQPMEMGQCGATVNWTLPTASDNCDTNPMITQTAGSMSGSFFTAGTETISYTASDASGNESLECSFTVTILSDMEKPSIVCPMSITQPMEIGQCGATINWTLPTASDNCDNNPMITQTAGSMNGSFFTEGTVTISYTASDASGNESLECSFTVTILSDMEQPTISCPMSITQPMEMGQCGSTVNWTLPTASDNCDTNPMITQTAGSMSGSFFTEGTETISYAATDVSGNESLECSFTVTILSDTEKPTIVCPMNITQPMEMGQCGATVNWTLPTASDNCDPNPTITQTAGSTSGSFFNEGTETISYTATDGSGNESLECSFTVTILPDDLKPEALCKNITVQLDNYGSASIVPQDLDNGSSDNCNTVSFSANKTTFNCGDVGTTQVTLTVTDANNNTDNCTADVTIEDNIPPVFTVDCPSNMVKCGAQNVSWIPPIATDNCTLTPSIISHNPGAYFGVGNTVVTYEYTDPGSQSISCSFEVLIHPLPDVSIGQSALSDFCQGLAVLNANVMNPTPPLTYAWSGGLGSEETVTVYANGNYDVTVMDGNGCQNTDTKNVNVVADQLLSGYVMIADDDLELKQTTVVGGGVGVIDNNGKAKIDDQSVVNTFAKADEVEVKGGSTVNQIIQSPTNLTLPAFRNNNNNNNNHITVGKGQMMTLTGSNYGNIKVKKGGTLNFDYPEIFVKKIDTEEGATIDFLQPCEMMVKGELKIDKENDFNPSGEAVILYLKKKLEVKEYSNVTGAIFTQKKIETKGESANEPTNMTGLFISLDDIKSDKWTNWNWSENCYSPNGGNQNMMVDDLFTFRAIPDQTEVELVWVSNLDKEIDSYILEKSADGIHFEPINQEASKSETREVQIYKNMDKIPFSDDNYYRLRLNYRDESTRYSDIQLVNFGALETFDIFPNPASEEVTVHLEQYMNQEIEIAIFNPLGQEVYRTYFSEIDNPWHRISLMGSDFRDGLYFVSVIHQGKTYSKRLMIAKL